MSCLFSILRFCLCCYERSRVLNRRGDIQGCYKRDFMFDILEMVANYVGAKIMTAFDQRDMCTKLSI